MAGVRVSEALERGLDVLEMLASRGELRAAELISELGVSRATAFRIMSTLENRGYAEHLRDERVWRLGPAVTELADGFDSTSIMQLAAPALADLRGSSRETVNLAVVHRNRVTWAATFDGVYALRFATTIGETVPVHSTAVGKAILSTMPDEEWKRLLPPEPFPDFTPNTRRTTAALRADVEACRSRGWAVDSEESELSGICVGAPIVGRNGRPVAAISVCSVAGRLPEAAREPLGREVRRRCDRISAELQGEGAQRASPSAGAGLRLA